MKREYAADTLKWNLTDLLTKEKDRATLDFLCECVDFLLKQPKPDAETGLAPCGCGGNAELCPVNDYYTARCERCRTTSDYYKTAGETIDAWNKALG